MAVEVFLSAAASWLAEQRDKKPPGMLSAYLRFMLKATPHRTVSHTMCGEHPATKCLQYVVCGSLNN
jgi:hypothetical protein